MKENIVAATCAKAGGYDEVTYCTVCKAKLSSTSKTVAKDPANHADYGTEVRNAKPATEQAPGYTGDTVCKGCGAVLQKGSEIAQLPSSRIEGEKVRETEKQTLAAQQKQTREDVLLAAPGARILDHDGKDLAAGKAVGSGMTLVKPDGSTLTVIVMGDNNGDGGVTAADARLALRSAVNLETFKDWQTEASLVGQNRKVTAAEARLILRGAVGLEKVNDWYAKEAAE